MTALEDRLTAALDRYADLTAAHTSETMRPSQRVGAARRRTFTALAALVALLGVGLAVGLTLASPGNDRQPTLGTGSETLAAFPGQNLKLVAAPADAHPELSASGAYLPYAHEGGLHYTRIPRWLHYRLAMVRRLHSGQIAGESRPSELVWAYSRHSPQCPNSASVDTRPCTEWLVLDANTGRMLFAAL